MNSQKLAMHLCTDKDDYIRGEPINAWIEIQNKNSEDAFYLDVDSDATLSATYVSISILNYLGTELYPAGPVVDPRPLVSGDVKRLPSGCTCIIKLGNILDESNFRFWVLNPGEYSLKATFINDARLRSRSERLDVLTSNVKTIQLK